MRRRVKSDGSLNVPPPVQVAPRMNTSTVIKKEILPGGAKARKPRKPDHSTMKLASGPARTNKKQYKPLNHYDGPSHPPRHIIDYPSQRMGYVEHAA